MEIQPILSYDKFTARFRWICPQKNPAPHGRKSLPHLQKTHVRLPTSKVHNRLRCLAIQSFLKWETHPQISWGKSPKAINFKHLKLPKLKWPCFSKIKHLRLKSYSHSPLMQNCSSSGLGGDNRWIMCMTWDVKPPERIQSMAHWSLPNSSSASPMMLQLKQKKFQILHRVLSYEARIRPHFLLPKYVVAKHP